MNDDEVIAPTGGINVIAPAGGINTLDPSRLAVVDNGLDDSPIDTPETRAKAQLERLLWLNEANAAADDGVPPDDAGANGGGPSSGGESRSGRRNRRRKSSTRSMVEWILVIVAALSVALLIKTTLIQAFFIPSVSMVPTLEVGDRVLVNKVSYKLHDIHRGDVVVFERPPGETNKNIKDLIKRVVALPGETVESKDGKVYINDRLLEEPYLPAGTVTTRLTRLVVPTGQVFVMGDNRGNSADSRVFGPINQSLIVGRAFVRIWPVSRLGFL